MSKNLKNEEVIERFLIEEAGTNKSKNLESEGDLLYHHATVIAQWYSGVLYVNRSKYTATTTRLVNQLLRVARKMYEEQHIIELTGDYPYGIKDLTKLVEP